MPDSEERTEFEIHLRRAVSQLNDWLDAGRRARRRLQRLISVTTYVVGVLSVFIAIPLIGDKNSAATAAVGIGVGALVSVVSLGSSYLIERSALKKARRSAEVLRLEALSKGEDPARVAAPQL
ncbi:MAG: hypothetical protein ABIO06_09650 [Pseudolysinimonas sp.]